MANKPLVLLDVDGVIGDFHTPAIDIANDMFDFNYTLADVNLWDIAKFMKLDEDQEKAFYERIKKPGFHERIKPYPDAVSGISALKEIAEVHALTSPMFGQTWCYERWDWLYYYFGLKGKDVTFTHRKERFDGHMLVDDKPSNISGWSERHPKGVGGLWYQPYTPKEDFPPHLNVMPFTNWGEVIKLVDLMVRTGVWT